MKRIFAVLLVLVLLVPCCLSVSAVEYHVADAADLLTEEEWSYLEGRAASISATYGSDVMIVTIDDFRDLADNREDAAYEAFDILEEGAEELYEGVMLFLSMDDRDYVLDSHGVVTNAVFSDRRKDAMEDNFLVYLRDNDWFNAFDTYLNDCEQYLGSGEDVVAKPSKFTFGAVVASLVLGAGIAAIVCGSLKRSMRSVAMASEAGAYVTEEGMNLTSRVDMFTHRTSVRRKIESSSSSSSGGGGHSSHSGKF